MVEMTRRLCDAVDRGPGHQPRQQRVLGKIFEVAAAARVANEIGRAAEQDVEAFGSRLGRDRLALPPRKRQVPG